MKICMIGIRGHNSYIFNGISGSQEDTEIVGIHCEECEPILTNALDDFFPDMNNCWAPMPRFPKSTGLGETLCLLIRSA